ncbi:MAG: NADPH-dependent FMN reductase [Betaproteobacteria bacterium RIFCSPLOWO2_02_64_14]|nr:MAG: NADPH-dependent FMN reductase [Betaproteobacteria bacterium RIFCSPLOWO2_02_64_14]
MTQPAVRRQSEWAPLTREQFRERFFARFYDPAFDEVKAELEKVFEKSWDGYLNYRKSPRKRAAGPGFADPAMQLPIEWLEARARIEAAEKRQQDPASPTRILIVNGSTRSEHTCPGEISKTRRLAQHAQKAIAALPDHEVDFLDVSTLADEPWKVIHPCKACVSTSQALCHWPCSCYPNHALGQTNDWMDDIYPRWVAAHGVFILCPVHWYQAPASLKLMIDRLVCADGGNPDPTTTRGKDPALAKELELKGWPYPKHLAGRAFAIVAHGDAAGPENLRRMLADWLTDIGMIQAGPQAALDTWIGWYRPYATSHEDLDADEETFVQVQNAALSLANMVKQIRTGAYQAPQAGLHSPREK